MTLTLHRCLTLVAIAVSVFILLALMVLMGPGHPCAQGLPSPLGTRLEHPPAQVDELTASRIEILVLKRQVVEEHAARATAESSLAYAELGRSLDAAIEAAAKHDGIDPTRYRLDLATRTWKKVTP